ncbi:arginine--tRNA ligase [Thermoplasmatales archaeon SG8-52-2]|nr:MAG: arginine--tRNA ligase [Thermoplasmatales archaeon SG8-52-2]
MSYPINDARNEIISELKTLLKKIGCKDEIKIETPPTNHGDFAVPCFSFSSIIKKPPNEIAKEIVTKFSKSKWIDKVEAKGPYINFFLDEDAFKSSVFKSLNEKKGNYGYLDKNKLKVIVEHTSANPNGPLHVGRARNPIIGDTIVRIFKAAGYNVESQFYLDDMGKQVAILAWGVNNLDTKDIPKSKYDKPDHKTVGFYQVSSKLLKENDEVSKEIGEIVKKSEEGDKKTIDIIHKSYGPVLDGINDSLKQMNITIDKYIPESNFVKDKSVNLIVEKLKKSKYCGKEEGAYYLDMEPFGIKGRNTNFFFLRKDGTTLYATRDIAYHLWKADHADLLVNVLGEDHKLESKQVEIALKLVNAKKIPKAIFYSFVSLPGGKMSTRQARVVYVDELIDECISLAYKEVKKRRGKELSENKMKEIAKIVGIGALRYNIIKVQPEKDMVFKWEEAINFEGNASPFIQYSHARACSILSKKQDELKDIDAAILIHESEENLIKKIAKFPIVIEDACNGYKPHNIPNYLFEIASQFNKFYRDCPVLPEKNDELRKARLFLVNATRIVLKNGLDILGIVAPKEM